MQSWDAEQRQLAKAVFNRPARVLLAAWVLERGTRAFGQQEVALELARLGEAPSAVIQELSRFVEWGMLERSKDKRTVMYGMRKEAPLWDVFRSAVSAFGLIEEG